MATTDTGAETGPTLTQDKLGAAAAPYVAKAKSFAKERPFAAAALAGVIGIAFLNTLRGK